MAMNNTKTLVAESDKKDVQPDLTPRIDNPLEPVFDFVYNENHVLTVQQVGVRDVDAEIQSYADTCGIEYVLKCVAQGDLSVLNAASPIYGNFVGAPETLAQAQSMVAAAEKSAETLPDNIKSGRSIQDIASLSDEDIKKLIDEAVAAKLAAAKEVTPNNG